MTAVNVDLSIDQGSNFTVDIFVSNCGVKPDLTGYTFNAQIRKEFNSEDPAVGQFGITLKNQTTDRGGFTLSLPADISSAFEMDPPENPQEFTPTKFVYDIEWLPVGGDPDEDLETIIRGVITVTPEVTK